MGARIGIYITELATRAIVDQAKYYADLQDQAFVARWEAAISQSIESLLTRPEPRLAKLKGLRRIPVQGFPQHFLFYQHSHDPRTIRIVRRAT